MGETVGEESGDMFSLTSSLIRLVSLPNTTRQLDLTVLRLPQSHKDYTFKHSNKHKKRGAWVGGEMPENRHNFKKTQLVIAEEANAEMFCREVVMTVWGVHKQSAIPGGCLWNRRMITNTVELACMNTARIE
ncbi:hypothetical protein Q8A73_004176 [Channa argus]|nr:hypothetical protein Q8A73_004176 [Channa argus]